MATGRSFLLNGLSQSETRYRASERGTAQKEGAPEGGASRRGVPQWEVLLGAGCSRRELQQTLGML